MISKIFKPKDDHHLNKEIISTDVSINEKLSELRIRTGADRAHVFVFQNGSTFSNKNQVWNVVCLFERLGASTASNCNDLKLIQSTSISDLIGIFWHGEEDKQLYPGMYKVSPEFCICKNKSTCTKPSGVYLCKVDELINGAAKGLLNQFGVHYVLSTPIFDMNKNITGYISLNWCYPEIDIKDITKHNTILCTTATTISYLIKK
jgi:hypothetical protein